MKSKIDQVTTNYNRLISCVLYQGGSDEILNTLYARGIFRAYYVAVRGSPIGRASQIGKLPEIPKTEFLQVLVSADQADYIYQLIYETAHLYEVQKGIIYINRVSHSSDYSFPDNYQLLT